MAQSLKILAKGVSVLQGDGYCDSPRVVCGVHITRVECESDLPLQRAIQDTMNAVEFLQHSLICACVPFACQWALVGIGDEERRAKTPFFNLLQAGKLLPPADLGLLRREEGRLNIEMRVEYEDGIVK
jgi:hypothetical protein